MKFALESELCEVLADRVLEALGRSSAATILDEARVGTVIPDLVVVQSERAGWDLRITAFESWIIAELLRSGRRRRETLTRRLFAREETIACALDRLERVGVVQRTAETTYALRRGAFPRDSEVVAVEAKLRRWREAVEQATAYLRFANRAYVALPHETIERVSELDEVCRTRGLGIIGVSPTSVDVIRRAPRHDPGSPGWVWLVARGLERREVSESKRSQALRATRAGARAMSAG